MVGLGTLMLVPFYIYDAALRGFTPPRREALMAAAYLGFGASALAYVLWNWSLQRLGAAEAGPFLHLVPAAGVLEAVAMLGERPQPYHVYGALGIAAGMVIFAFGRLRHVTPLNHSEKGNPSATPAR
jgi:drug/metabolite transporter (DMT)-like permease